MRILITGACGFTGSILATELLASVPGARLSGVDNLIRRGSQLNVEPLRRLGVDLAIADVREAATFERLPPVDWVVDAAANPSVLAGVAGGMSPRDVLDHNLVGTINVLEYCRARGAGLIFLSTSRVYSSAGLAGIAVREVDGVLTPSAGQPGVSPAGITEAFSTDPPLSIYGVSKRCSELLALEYADRFGFPLWINRCGVLAGAGQFGKADQGIFSFWVHAHRERHPLKYIGFGATGCQVRDCLHPGDLATLIRRQMSDTARAGNRIFNVSGGEESAMSLRELSAWCAARFQPMEIARETDSRPFDAAWIVLDSSPARARWTWRPERPVPRILEDIATHAEQHPSWLEATC